MTLSKPHLTCVGPLDQASPPDWIAVTLSGSACKAFTSSQPSCTLLQYCHPTPKVGNEQTVSVATGNQHAQTLSTQASNKEYLPTVPRA